MDNPFLPGSQKIPVIEIVLRQTPRLFDFDDFIEGQNLTRIHQVVCGPSDVSLDVELQNSTDIDTLDGKGRSALWYAVAHRRHDHIYRLLEKGADPNTGDLPILRALEFSPDYAIIKALLDHRSNFGSFKESFSVDQWAGTLGYDTLAIDELLVKHGLHPNHQGNGGETILMALHTNHHNHIGPSRLKHLVKLGADTEITDEWGLTAIMHAVRYRSPRNFGILARAGARVDVKSAKGTILHLATYPGHRWYSDCVPELCDVMRDVDLTNLDLDAEDENGNRAFDLLRVTNGPNWVDYCNHSGAYWFGPFLEYDIQEERKAISALEELLHYVQEVQGVPEADRYPPLGEYCSRIIEEEPVPGAWPMY